MDGTRIRLAGPQDPDGMEDRDSTLDRSSERDTASAAGYGAALVWALACLALYGWQLIEIALG